MSVEQVRSYLKSFAKDQDIIETEQSSATVALAAQALGTEPQRIAKSLAFQGENGVILVVTSGDCRIDNAKFKQQFGRKATMLGQRETLELVGHAVGGVCPFALREGVEVFLDVSLKRFETVYPACGSSNSAIRLTPDELEQCAQFFQAWVDVCKTV